MIEKSDDVVAVKKLEPGILRVNLHRPQQLNALSTAVLQKLLHIFEEAKHDASVKAILLTGEGKGFCAGADIKELVPLTGPSGLAFARFGQLVCLSLERLNKPSLAAIHGFALGGGCELAMAATLRIAAENTVFSQPEIQLGLIPGFGGTQRLTRLIGKGRALAMCLTGRRFTAAEALQWGFLNEVVTQENLLSRACSLLQELIQLSPVATQSILASIQQGCNMPLEEACELEAAHFALCCTYADKQEGVSAFLEKRAAKFSGE
jgi:enoyl-CoA hydratase